MTLPILHSCPFTSGVTVSIALEEAGIAHETRYVNLRAGEHRQPAFLAMNPKGQVPALVLPDGRVLTEHPALMAWAAMSAPASGLLPADPGGAAEAMQWAAWGAWMLATGIGPAFAPGRFAEPATPEAEAAIRARGMAKLHDAMALAEAALEGRDWLVGGGRTIADISLSMVAGAAMRFGVPAAEFPRVVAHGERFGALPGVQRARARDKAAAGA
jgi:glutathione S-transferase